MATWKRLKNGDWGILDPENRKVGQKVKVTTRAGKVQEVEVVRVLWTDGSTSISEIKKVEKADIRIEYPSAGATYCRNEYGVYKYDEYPRGSVLEGQQRRTFLDSFQTKEEAVQAYPDATEDCGIGYQAPFLNHLPETSDY